MIKALLIPLLMLCGAPVMAEDCAEDKLRLKGEKGQARFKVELADTDQERAQGLMFREEMGRFEGMLFVYEEERPVAFWMKNTLIPLDMLFFDEAGRLVHIHEHAIPHDETPIPSGEPVQFVLEINAGMSATLGLETGMMMQHPAIAPEKAALPCKK